MSQLLMQDVTKCFGSFKALDKINLQLNEGEVYGFIGPNGAGKTTTIRVLLGILKATEGNAQIFGLDVWKDAVEIHKRIAYVPGDVSLWQNLTGGEVIDLLVSLRKGGDAKYRQQLVKKFDLDTSKKCRSYSKGNRQKVALVAAFASDADLYILDEPTSGLDPLMESVFIECVQEVKNKGKTVLLSSHILHEVEKLCDKLSIIKEGKIVQSGTLDEMRHLTRLQLSFSTKKPIQELPQIVGAHDIKFDGHEYSLMLDSDKIDSAMKALAQLELKTFACSQPSLEQMFMQHYEKE